MAPDETRRIIKAFEGLNIVARSLGAIPRPVKTRADAIAFARKVPDQGEQDDDEGMARYVVYYSALFDLIDFIYGKQD